MHLESPRSLKVGLLILALSQGATALAAPQGDPSGADRVKNFIAATRDIARYGGAAVAVIAAQAKTESTATAGLLAAVAQGLKDKSAAQGTDTAPTTIEPEVKKLVVATRDLLALRDKALEPVVAAMKDPANADVKDPLEKAEGRIYMALCVGAMRAYIRPNGRYDGTFQGMYASLEKYDRDKIGDAFLEIFKSQSQTSALRELAGEGVAQLGSARHLEAVRALYGSKTESDGMRRRALYTMARLGDRSIVDKMTAAITAKMAEMKKPEMTPQEIRAWADGYFQIALLGQNIHDTDLAITNYESFLAAVEPVKDKLPQKENHQSNYYNLACLYSLKGDVDGGLKALERSFASGWDNYKWANTDGDLANLRKDARFKAMIEKWESGKGQAESAPASRP